MRRYRIRGGATDARSSRTANPPATSTVVVMGVSGSGKTTVGEALAAALGAEYVEGDNLHTEAAREKMRSGVPLTDDDRWPWLDRIAAALAADGSSGVVVACSALRRIYRDRLRRAVGTRLRFVYLEATPGLMRQRVAGRRGHYMPASLVESQFRTLEPPVDEGDVLTVPADMNLKAGIPKLARVLSAPV